MVLRGALTAWRKRQKTKREKNFKKYLGQTLSPIEVDNFYKDWETFQKSGFSQVGLPSEYFDSYKTVPRKVIAMTGMNAPSKSDPMFDLIKTLDVREKDLDAYIKSIADEKNRLSAMQKELSVQQEQAERDLMKVQRAKAVLRDDEAPSQVADTGLEHHPSGKW